MKSSRQILLKLRSELQRVADPRKASGMQRYMKSVIPYHGVATPALREIFKNVYADVDLPDAASWKAAVLHIWRNARFREEKYAAIALCEWKKANEFQTPMALPMYEEMVVTGAWWDLVDTVASHCVGGLLRRYPDRIGKSMRVWSRCPDIWKRRTSIICQLGSKKNTDLDLLYACIEPSL